jgi:hypothetical protein
MANDEKIRLQKVISEKDYVEERGIDDLMVQDHELPIDCAQSTFLNESMQKEVLIQTVANKVNRPILSVIDSVNTSSIHCSLLTRTYDKIKSKFCPKPSKR